MGNVVKIKALDEDEKKKKTTESTGGTVKKIGTATVKPIFQTTPVPTPAMAQAGGNVLANTLSQLQLNGGLNPLQLQQTAQDLAVSSRPKVTTRLQSLTPTSAQTGAKYTYESVQDRINNYQTDFDEVVKRYGATQDKDGVWTFQTQTGLNAANKLQKELEDALADYNGYYSSKDYLEQAVKDAQAKVDQAKQAESEAWDAYNQYNNSTHWSVMDTDKLNKLAANAASAQTAREEAESYLSNLTGTSYYRMYKSVLNSMDKETAALYAKAKDLYEAQQALELAVARGDGVDKTEQEAAIQRITALYGADALSSVKNIRALSKQLNEKLEEYRTKLRVRGADYDLDRMIEYEDKVASQQTAEAKAAELSKWIDEHGFWGKVAASAGSVLASPAQGGEYLGATIQSIGHNDPTDLSTYVPMDTSNMEVTNFVSGVRENVAEDMGGVGSFLYNTGMSIADSAFQVGMLGSAATYFMGMSAASNQMKNIIERGGTNQQAIVGGLAAGAAEALFEHFSIDQLLKAKNVTGIKSLLKETAKQAGVEASEEVFTEIANIMADGAIMGENSEYNNLVAYYQTPEGGGLSEDEARKKAYLERLGQVALAGLGGLISGGVMGGTVGGKNAVVNAARTKAFDAQVGKQLVSGFKDADGTLKNHIDLVEQGLNYAQNSQTYKLASQLNQTLNDKGVDAATAISSSQWGKLQRVMAEELEQFGPQINSPSAQIAQQTKHDVVQALHPDEKVISTTAQMFMDAGVNATDADARADILDRIAAGDSTLSNSKIKDLNFHDAATRAVYAQVMGHELPATTANKDLLSAVRADIAAVNEQKAQAEEAAKANAALERTMEAMMQAKASEAEAAKLNAQKVLNDSAEAIKADMVKVGEENAKAAQETSAQTAAEPVSQTAPTVKLSNGEELTEEQFVQRYQAVKNVDAAEAQRVFKVAQDTNGFGQAFPATGLTTQVTDGTERHSASRRQRTSQGHDTRQESQQTAKRNAEQASAQPVEAGEADSVKTTTDTSSEIKPIEGRQIADEGSLTAVQKTTIKVLRDALGLSKASARKSKSIITAVEYVHSGVDAYEAFYDEGTGTLYINADRMTTGGEIMSVISHELTHAAETKDAGIVDALLAFGQDELGIDVEAEVKATTEQYKSFFAELGKSEEYISHNTTEALMRGEVAAEIMRHAVFPNVATLNILGRENRTTLQRIRDGMERFVARLLFSDPAAQPMQSECERLVERLNTALKNTENESTIKAQTGEVRHSAGEGNGEKAETRSEFLHRAGRENKEVATGKRGCAAFRPANLLNAEQEKAREAQRELTALGIQSYLYEGPVEANVDGRTVIDSEGASTTIAREFVMVRADLDRDPIHTAGHEAFHVWGGSTQGIAFKNLVYDQLIYGPAYAQLAVEVEDQYFPDGVDFENQTHQRLFREEFVAEVAGMIHSGADVSGLLTNSGAVEQAWQGLVHKNAPDYEFDNLNTNNEGTPATGEDAFSLPEKRYSISRAQDQTYAEAVENGDIVKAQKMVDEAAKAAGYVQAVFHGTDEQFNRFDRNIAKQKAVEHNWEASYPPGTIFLASKRSTASGYGSNTMNLYLDTTGMKTFKHKDMYAAHAMDELHTGDISKYPVIAVEGSDATVYATLSGTRVKRTDAAIYDDNGDLIPLSKRFNKGNSDVRYSVGRARTDTEEFRNWFHDDSGELTNPDGTPKVFLRGDTFSGATQFFSGAENHSGGIFFSTDMDTAGFYAHQRDDSFSMAAPEFMPQVFESWNDAFMSTQDGELGNNVAVERTPDGWELMVRRRAENRVRWETLATFPNTAEGLAQFNDQYGQILRDAAVENPAYMQVYLSAQNTKVIDAEGRTWNDVDSAGLRTNDLARQAWEDGYDMVIVKNVQDGAPAGMEFDEFDNYKAVLKTIDVFIAKDSTQVKSVYNTGSFDAENPDVRYSAGNAYREYAPTFYSKMEQEISAFKQAKMGASSVVSYLKGHGVKDEEIKWSGIEQWLEGKKSVTKEELLEFAKLNAIELEVQELDGHREVTQLLDETTGELYTDMEHMREVVESMAEAMGYDPEDVRYDYGQYPSNGWIYCYVYKDGDEIDLTYIQATFSDKEAQWEQYKTPGGDNYRELLYKMPGSEYTNYAMDVHWGQAGEGEGVLAHARVQDFETEDGTMLFIDEIQSDWHNAGAKSGYVTKDVEALQQELRDLRAKDVFDSEGKTEAEVARETELNKLLYPKHAELNERRRALQAQLSEDAVLSSVVDKIAEVKFDGNRRYAENNIHTARSPSMYIDGVSALGVRLTAEESDALRKFINSVNDWNAENQEYTMNGGREAELANRAPEAPYSKNYHEYVLKRLIREAAEQGYDSIGWTTGKMQEERWSSEYAEGYRIEYDQDMPKFLNKYGKQWGAKVEKAHLNTKEENAYNRNGDLAESYERDIEYWQRELEKPDNTDDQIEFILSQIDYAQDKLRALEAANKGPEIWKMKITDQMREDVLYKGQPRYSAGKKGYNPNLNYPSWTEQVEAYQKHKLDALLRRSGDRASVMYVAAEPTTLLKKLGLSDLPLVVTRSHMKQIFGQRWDKNGNVIDRHSHELSADIVKLLPQLIQHPVMVLKSDPSLTKGGVEIVTNLADKRGNPIVVTIKPDQADYTYDGVDGPAHFVNIFGRENFDARLEESYKNNQVLYINKERANAVQLSASDARRKRTYGIDSDVIIQQKDPTVKPAERRFSAGKKGNTKTGGSTGNVNPETGYEAGSVADSFMRILNTGDRQGALDALEEAARMLAETKAERAEQQRQEQLSQVFRPKLTEDAIERNERIINELITKYGEMEQTSAAQQEVHFPKQIDDKTKVRGFVQTAAATNAATEDVRNTLADDIVKGRVGATYQPISDASTMAKINAELATKSGFDAVMRDWRSAVDSGKFPSKELIAKGEALFVQACAEGQTFEAQKLASEIAIMGTQLGQAVQAMSLVKRMTPAGQLYYIQKTVDRLNTEKAQQKRNVRIVIDEKLAQQLLAAKTKEEMDAAIDAIIQSLADQMPVTIYDKWNTWRYLAMLGNPRTHFRNLAGNAIFVPARLIKDVAAMGMERMVIKDKSKRTKGIADKDLRAFAMEDADLMGDELRDGGKYETKDLIRDRRRIFKLAPLNWAAQTNSRLLEAEDWVFLKSAYANALGGYLAAQGFTAEQVHGANSTPEGRAALDRARVYAVEEAKKATYRDASKLAQWMNHSARNMGLFGSVVWGGLMPFTKTPVNIVKRGIEYSPVGLLNTITRGAFKLYKGDITAAQYIDSLAAGLTGFGIFGLGIFLSKMGLLVGGLGDEDEDKFEQLQGNQEYSIRVLDHSFTIDWMAPTVLPLFVGAEYERLGAEDGTNVWESIEAAAGLLDPIMSLSMLDGLNQTLSAVKYDTGEPIPAILQTIVGSYVSQGIPTVLGSVARTIDDSRRASFTPSGQTSVQRWLSRLWQTSLLGKTPFAAEKRMAYVDEWGRTDTESSMLMRALENFVSPGYINPLKETPLESEIARLAEATGDNGVYPNKADKSFTVNGEDYAMSQDEYEEHLLFRGQKSYQLASDITTSRSYDALDDTTRAMALGLAYSYAATLAKLNTNSAYSPSNKWMVELNESELDEAEYIMLYAEKRVKGGSMTDLALSSTTLSAMDVAEILLIERDSVTSFDDPYVSGYEYRMDEAAQERYAQMYHDLYPSAYLELVQDDEFIEGTLADRKRMVSELGTEVGKQVKYDMADWYWEQGIDSTEKS